MPRMHELEFILAFVACCFNEKDQRNKNTRSKHNWIILKCLSFPSAPIGNLSCERFPLKTCGNDNKLDNEKDQRNKNTRSKQN